MVFADPDALLREWELRATGNVGGGVECDGGAVSGDSGRLETFTFLDPAGNLLLSSEEFGAPEWNNGPLISLTAGMADPLGADWGNGRGQ